MTQYRLAEKHINLAKKWQRINKVSLFIYCPDEHNVYKCVMLVSARFMRVATGLKGSYKSFWWSPLFFCRLCD